MSQNYGEIEITDELNACPVWDKPTGIKVLVADDSVTIQKVITIIFGGDEYSLTVVNNGKAAIDKAREISPDIMLFDARMPGLTGYEVSEAVRANPSLADKPILLMTSPFEPPDAFSMKKSGVYDFINKPFESQQLLDKVTKLLEFGNSAPPSAEVPQAQPFYETICEMAPEHFAPIGDAPTTVWASQPTTLQPPLEDIWGELAIEVELAVEMTTAAPEVADDGLKSFDNGTFPDFAQEFPDSLNLLTASVETPDSPPQEDPFPEAPFFDVAVMVEEAPFVSTPELAEDADNAVADLLQLWSLLDLPETADEGNLDTTEESPDETIASDPEEIEVQPAPLPLCPIFSPELELDIDTVNTLVLPVVEIPEPVESRLEMSTPENEKHHKSYFFNKKKALYSACAIIGIIITGYLFYDKTPPHSNSLKTEKLPVIQSAAPLPSFIPAAGRDAGYSSKMPGWERYIQAGREYRLFRHEGRIKTLQILATGRKPLDQNFIKTTLKELTASADLTTLPSEEKQAGFIITQGSAGTRATLLIYKNKGVIRAVVVSMK